MSSNSRTSLRFAARSTALAGLTAGLCACSMVPSWLGGPDNTPVYPSDTAPQASSSSGQTPDLGSIPNRPAAQLSDATAQVTQSLESDRARANYSAEALRGGTDEVVAPPPDAAPPVAMPPPDKTPPAATATDTSATAATQANATPPAASSAGSPTASTSAPADASAAVPPPPADASGSGAPTVSSVVDAPDANVDAPPPPPRPTFDSPVAAPVKTNDYVAHASAFVGKAPMPGALPPPGTSASLSSAPVPTGVPLAQAATVTPPQQAAPSSTPTASPPPQTAPAPPIQTATAEPPPVALTAPPPPPVSAAPPPAASDDAALGFKPSAAPPLDPSVSRYVPGSVMARYGRTAPVATASAAPAVSGPSTRAATIAFAKDATTLDNPSREQVRATAELFKSHGGAGYVRVVGHASSAPSSLSAEKKLESDFEHSQARANAVAQALIAAGVPAARILIETAGPAQDASAEIFFQG